MFTVEFEPDASVIRSLDETGRHEDVEVIIGDDAVVYIRQWDVDFAAYQMLILTYQQLLDITSSLNTPEGMYRLMRGRQYDGTGLGQNSTK
jgi:hypothetical protein